MLNSNEPIKVVHIQKLANQLININTFFERSWFSIKPKRFRHKNAERYIYLKASNH